MAISKQAMALLRGAYPGFKDEQIQAYGIMLNDIPVVLQFEAVKNLLKTHKFLPAISEIRDEASKLAHRAAGDKITPPEMEWEVVYKAIGAIGPYRKPEFKSPLTEKAVKAMGWQMLCGSEEVMMPTLRSQFIKTWREMEQQEKTKRRMDRSMNEGLKELTQNALKNLEGAKTFKLEERK